MQPLGGGFGGFGGERLHGDGLEEFALLLPGFGAFADALAGGGHEEGEVIAGAGFGGIEDVIAQAKAVFAALAAEVEGVERARGAGGEEVDGIAVALGFEELPDGLDAA